ncbi:hypothetical protein CERSUDRAFT_114186 [Gelatoporia subvermispora B]|uniref:DUF6534 domain-containing protein n=1 Tax=Ceriporiopsis subvermispora (strain B) TaxID=914234 RepID=M2PMD8_CERS8|nr:hypothetical protein CERSUDRAFT_114186 [Gelatoporia subvermispora B]
MIEPSVDNTVGAVLIGVVVAAVLYGTTTMQTLTYYERSPNDPVYIRFAVFVLWLLSTVHQALITQTLWTYAVTEFGRLNQLETWCVKYTLQVKLRLRELEQSIRGIVAHIPITGAIDCIIRCLFCLSVWRLNDKKLYPTIPVLLSILFSVGKHQVFGDAHSPIRRGYLTQCLIVVAGSIALFVKCIPFDNFTAFTSVSWVLLCALGSNVVADILLASSLAIMLRTRRTGFRNTDSVIRNITWYGVVVALLTTLMSMLCIITYETMPKTLVIMSIYFTTPGLMLNALLTGYNSRKNLRQMIVNAGDLVTITRSNELSVSIELHRVATGGSEADDNDDAQKFLTLNAPGGS